jgi:hypothetical protein
MKTLALFTTLAIFAAVSTGCAVVAGHPHHYYYDEPEVIVVAPVPPPPPPVYFYYGPGPGPYYGPPHHWRR